ncbi:ComEA family DNA-binding protein [Maribacter chungangensis]|uniref:ComEA family DNA-binding protein n=1 Tax=Maribacter chungangensis TaxID=1069117 RepID=A0ABW3B4W0_9FLAO
MKNLKSHLKFNKQERSGIFFLLLLLILLQVGHFLFKDVVAITSQGMLPDKETQNEIDLLRKKSMANDTVELYPFNPNFITDYKGYTLGLTVAEIDRLHSFREGKKFVNTAAEFQKVTKVSDSILNRIAPYFKFPDWVTETGKTKARTKVGATIEKPKAVAVLLDLNTATEEQLKGVNGIGDKLAARIIKFRDRLGGFLMDEQLSDVYGLKPEVVARTLELFRVKQVPEIRKLDINIATAEELAQIVYIPKKAAYDIVAFREDNGGIRSFDELLEIETFPADRINRIALYLLLKN